MPVIQYALFALAAILLLMAFYLVIRGDWRRMLHLIADATLLLYVGCVAVGPLPPDLIIYGGAVVVAVMLSVSGWLYARENRKSTSTLAWIAALAVLAVIIAYYAGYLK